MAPFGSNSILTVDLGQQYIDYFAFFKRTILHDPSALTYSFSAGIGQNMVGEWAYYLLSPLNWLLLAATPLTLPVWLLFLTVLKFGLAALSMVLLLNHSGWVKGYWSLPFALSYALSGWFVANTANLLWLDAAAFLPILILAMEHFLHTGKQLALGASLTSTILLNYYMAWMIALFLLCYLFFRLLASGQQNRWQRFFAFVKTASAAILLTAWLWLPTLFQLRQSKSSQASPWSLAFVQNPFGLLWKLVPGTFNFDQMQAGQANWLVAPLVLILAGSYFTNRHFALREKIVAGATLLVFVLASSWQPLLLLFHGFQEPIWYPARFSFLLSFFLILLAARSWQQGWQPSLLATISWSILPALLALAAVFYPKRPDYLTAGRLTLFVVLFLLTAWAARLIQEDSLRLAVLFLLSLVYLLANLSLSLNQLSYLSLQRYQAGASRLLAVKKALPSTEQGFYRLGQGLTRDQNDALLVGFHGENHFSSLNSRQSARFFQQYGQTGTSTNLVTSFDSKPWDALLSNRYYLAATSSLPAAARYMAVAQRPDYQGSPTVASGAGWQLKENQDALPFLYAASDEALNQAASSSYPLTNQVQLLKALNPSVDSPWLTEEKLTVQSSQGLQLFGSSIKNAVIRKKQAEQSAQLRLTFTPNSNDSYYLNLGPAFKSAGVTIKVNGQAVSLPDSRDNAVALNLAANQKGQNQTISFDFPKGTSSYYLDNVSLLSLNQAAFSKAVQHLQQSGAQYRFLSNTRIQAQVRTSKDQPLIMTGIPADPGWQVRLDGHRVKAQTVAHTFLAIKTQPGRHQLSLTYRPPFLRTGWLITGFTMLWLLGRTYQGNRSARLRRR